MLPIKRAVVEVPALRLFEEMALDMDATRTHVAEQYDHCLGEIRPLAERAEKEVTKLDGQAQRITADYRAGKLDADTFASLEEPINRFNTFYRDVRPGDRYALTYLPGLGIELALNGERLGIIEGEELASAIFAIWFGDNPADESLKLELLGRS